MTTRAQIEAMEKKQAQLAQALSQAKKRLNGEARAADTHIKAAVGGALLALLYESKYPAGFETVVLARAEYAVQKQGLGREKFEALKARFKKTEEQK